MRKHSPDKFALFTKQIRRTWPRRQGSDDDEVINMRRRMFQEPKKSDIREISQGAVDLKLSNIEVEGFPSFVLCKCDSGLGL